MAFPTKPDGDLVAERANRLSRVVKPLLWSVTSSLFTGRALAQTNSTEVPCGSMPPQFQEIATLLTRVQQLGVALALLIASVMLIYGGILWMRGTPDAQQKARRIIFDTIIGLVIVLIAGGLVEFVKSVLCGGA